MAGILANSASKTMTSGSADNSVSGYLVGEQVVLTVTPTGTDYVWAIAKPSGSASARSNLDATTGASVKFTPDAEGYFTVSCVVDSTTTYTLRIAAQAIGTVTYHSASNFSPLNNAQVPVPALGHTWFHSTELGGPAYKVGATVYPISGSRVTLESYGGGVSKTAAENSAALTSALATGMKVELGSGTYTVGAAVTVPNGATIKGQGRGKTILSAGANNILFPAIGDDVTISDLAYVGNGATYAASGFATFTGTSGARFIGENLSLTDSGGYEIEYAATTAGSQAAWKNCIIARYNGVGTGRYSVKIPDTLQTSAYPRKFIDIETNGTDFIDLGGCNNLFLTGGYFGRVLFSDNSRGVFSYGCRYGGETVNRRIIKGANHTFSACDFSQNLTDGICVELGTGAAAVSIAGCTYNSIYPVLDSSGQGSINLVDHRAMVFVPTITTASGPAFVLGNGDARATFVRSGGNVTLQMELTLGSTTTIGTGVLRFSLVGSVYSGIAFTSLGNALVPVSGIAQTQNGTGLVEDVSVPDRRVIIPRVVQGQNYLECFVEGGSQQLTGTTPFTLAAGDLIRFSITYQL
jgi:hypothetical protein